MENTLENKAKFFAQYWGQSIFSYTDTPMLSLKQIIDFSLRDVSNKILEIKPLSSIADEDAAEVGNLFLIATDAVGERDFSHEDILVMLDECGFLPFQVVDYLRSKGYALPWMGLYVEQQIDYGWVKLKSE